MGFDPNEYGGKERESVEFWKPETEGDAIVGRVESFKRGKIGDDDTLSMTLSPVVVMPENAKKGQGYASLRVGINSVLAARISEKDQGKVFAIVFTGMERTQAGKMRVFKVYELTPDKFRVILDKHAPGLANGDDDLPF